MIVNNCAPSRWLTVAQIENWAITGIADPNQGVVAMEE